MTLGRLSLQAHARLVPLTTLLVRESVASVVPVRRLLIVAVNVRTKCARAMHVDRSPPYLLTSRPRDTHHATELHAVPLAAMALSTMAAAIAKEIARENC